MKVESLGSVKYKSCMWGGGYIAANDFILRDNAKMKQCYFYLRHTSLILISSIIPTLTPSVENSF